MMTTAEQQRQMTTCSFVAVGVSSGGFAALKELLSSLPEKYPVPIAIVQHRGRDEKPDLAEALSQYSVLPIREVEDKDEVRANSVYLAPSDYHLLVDESGFVLSVEAPVSYARPSIDVLLESAADAFGSSALAIVLTGANSDGAAGAAKVKAAGGTVIVQDPETAACPVLPRAVISACEVDHVFTLAQIAHYLGELKDLRDERDSQGRLKLP